MRGFKFLVTLSTCLVWTSLLTVWLNREIPAQAQARAQPLAQQSIQAQQVQVVDKKGNVVIVLGSDKAGRGLIQLADEFGNAVVVVTSGSHFNHLGQAISGFTYGMIATKRTVVMRTGPTEVHDAIVIGGARLGKEILYGSDRQFP